MKSKKGALPFAITLVIMMVFVLIYAWLMLASKYDAFDKKIGEKQYDLINTYQSAEKTLFYIDQSSKYSAYQSIYDLGQKGGYENSDCGNYLGYNLWINFDEEENLIECYPKKEAIEENFKSIFNTNLNFYLIKYPDVEIPEDNYDILLKTENNKLEILGKAKEKLFFEIKEEKNS